MKRSATPLANNRMYVNITEKKNAKETIYNMNYSQLSPPVSFFRNLK
jgi:hypothetical protein